MDKDQIMEIIRKRVTRLDEWLQNSEKSMSKLKKARKEWGYLADPLKLDIASTFMCLKAVQNKQKPLYDKWIQLNQERKESSVLKEEQKHQRVKKVKRKQKYRQNPKSNNIFTKKKKE